MTTEGTYNADDFQKYSSGDSLNVFKPTEELDTNPLLSSENIFTKKNVFNEKLTGKTVVSVFDVASYILKNLPTQSCSTMKLHKLLYYSQAWSLVWDESPLFTETIEAWANGPVIPDLFYYHKGLFTIKYEDFTLGNSQKLSDYQRITVDAVLEFYGSKPAQWLIDLTHLEDPWKNARKGLRSNERSKKVIQLDDMANYYSSI